MLSNGCTSTRLDLKMKAESYIDWTEISALYAVTVPSNNLLKKGQTGNCGNEVLIFIWNRKYYK